MKGIRQGLPIVEMERFEDFVDPAIEAPHHSIGLGIERRREAMFDVMCLAGIVTGGCQKVFETLFGTDL